uniref:Uncharacterized protein n=1 Tax=Cyanistes caeruleus TaxID=156563 RepID=A0A8C0ZGK4_CYACU
MFCNLHCVKCTLRSCAAITNPSNLPHTLCSDSFQHTWRCHLVLQVSSEVSVLHLSGSGTSICADDSIPRHPSV